MKKNSVLYENSVIVSIILSRGQYNHTGRLLSVLQIRKEKVPEYVYPDTFNN